MRVLAAVATLLIVTPVFAADKDAPKSPKPPKEKKICRALDSSATRLGPSVCKTQAEWDADRAAQQRDLDKMSHGS